jgi:hypothetical protein
VTEPVTVAVAPHPCIERTEACTIDRERIQKNSPLQKSIGGE